MLQKIYSTNENSFYNNIIDLNVLNFQDYI